MAILKVTLFGRIPQKCLSFDSFITLNLGLYLWTSIMDNKLNFGLAFHKIIALTSANNTPTATTLDRLLKCFLSDIKIFLSEKSLKLFPERA